MRKFVQSILQVNTYGISGGAGKAAYRLHKGLVSAGQESKYLVKQIKTQIPGISIVPHDKCYKRNLVNDRLINKYYLWFNRTAITNTYFSFSYPGYEISNNQLVRDADIINLHWTEDFLSPRSLNSVFSLNKPVVWTLHDQKPFTGGCHYSAGCNHYENSCQACPQLLEDPYSLPNAILNDKIELFRGANLTIVAPSLWLAQEARKSMLFKSKRVEAIPNSVETDIYSPVDKKKAKKLLGIDSDSITIMFGSADASERRKGFKNLMAAAQVCLKDREFRRLVELKKIVIICVGKADSSIKELPIQIRDMGYVENDGSMAGIYNAADLFVLPSLEDNLPNTMLEAMACGTPVVAFKVGGMPDVITNDVNGKLVDCQNDTQLGKSILELVMNRTKRQSMGAESASLIRKKYKLEDQANNYLNLYSDLLKNINNHKKKVIPAKSQYGPYTVRSYSKLMQFSIKNYVKIRFNIKVKSKVMLYLISFFLRIANKIIPADVFDNFKIY